MNRNIILIIISLLTQFAAAQNIEYKSISAKYSGNDSWRDWDVKTSEGSGSMRTTFSGDEGWKKWNVNLPNIS